MDLVRRSLWFADHTVQIGVEKCLVVLGIRQCDWPPAGTCLALEHLEPLLIEPMHHALI